RTGGPPDGTRNGPLAGARLSVAHKFRWGDPRSSLAPLLATLPLIVLSVLLGGCGEEGVEEDAVLSVYISAPLCPEAKEELDSRGGRAGEFRLRVLCVDDLGATPRARLTAIGAAARRATEDSAAVAYVGSANPVSVRFSEPILEEADVARISSGSGSAAMRELLRTLERGEAGVPPRELVSHLRSAP
ncbi:MAG TPA: hypothetical protein VHF50_01720, partial [Solirubrobacterales bacterium]|nr:hypothetical protein [Solirubrobacterales bacterium]